MPAASSGTVSELTLVKADAWPYNILGVLKPCSPKADRDPQGQERVVSAKFRAVPLKLVRARLPKSSDPLLAASEELYLAERNRQRLTAASADLSRKQKIAMYFSRMPPTPEAAALRQALMRRAKTVATRAVSDDDMHHTARIQT